MHSIVLYVRSFDGSIGGVRICIYFISINISDMSCIVFFVCCFLTWRLSLPPSPFRRVFFAADIEPSAMSVCCVGVLFLHHTLRLLPSPFRCIAVTIVCFRHSAVRHEIVLLIST